MNTSGWGRWCTVDDNLAYEVREAAGWLSVDPTTGSSADEDDTITISYYMEGFGVGTYEAIIQVSDSGSTPPAANSPQTISVLVKVKTVLPDLDLDGDVEDFGQFQRCVGESNLNLSSSCHASDLNRDALEAQEDLDILVGCFSAPNVLADKTCDDSIE